MRQDRTVWSKVVNASLVNLGSGDLRFRIASSDSLFENGFAMPTNKRAIQSSQISTKRSDRGQASMMLIAVFAILALVAIASSLVARRAIERSRAQNAADALALGALVGDTTAPSLVAASNGVETFDLTVGPSEADVSVTVGAMTARARAQRTGNSQLAAPAMVAVMARLAQLAGRAISYEVVVPDPYLGGGLPSFTVDVDPDAVGAVLEHADALVLCRPDPANNPAQFRLC